MRKISIFVSNTYEMKRIIGFVALVLFLNACDDGELTVQTIDFTSVAAVKCNLNDIIYKLNGTEILALEVPASENAFINEPTLPDTPRVVTLNATNRVVYRSYNGAVSSGNICATLPATSPNVIEEWTANSGRIEIITTAVLFTNTTTNATTITKYNHYIVFKDITFIKPSGVQVYETFVFGNYQTDATSLPFGFDVNSVQKCSASNQIYNFSGSESLTLDIAPTLYPNAVGTQTAVVSAANKVTYKLFTSGLSPSYFCVTPSPATPVLNQEWNAIDGVANVSGIIEVITTTESATSYRHFIHLKKVTFKKGNSTFTLGDDYLYGSFVTN
jgi:hypothetical protein